MPGSRSNAARHSNPMRVIGENLHKVARGEALLERAPPSCLEDLAVLLQEDLLGTPFESEELQECLREYVVLADVEPALSPHLVLVGGRLRHVAEAAVGDPAELVVIVED